MSFHPKINKINSKAELFSVVESARAYRFQQTFGFGRMVMEMYRGQGRDEWTLRPNIVRKLATADKVKQVEFDIVSEFNTRLSEAGFSKALQGGFLPSYYHSDWLLLQQAQHYRIPTRFMDWTIDWEVALFFAVSNPEDDDHDGQFWIYIVPPEMKAIDNESDDNYIKSNPFEFDRTIFLNSSGFLSADYLDQIGERRKNRQHGRFCIQPYDTVFTPLEKQAQHIPNLSKIIIPKELKSALRKELEDIGITNDTLYVHEHPDINNIVKELQEKYAV